VTLELRRERVEDCVAFYELIGFERVDPPESLRERAAWVQRGATQIHLLWVDDPVTLPSGHVAVVPPDYDVALERLRVGRSRGGAQARALGVPARVRARSGGEPGGADAVSAALRAGTKRP
jgi:hypothetical protein